MIANGGAHHGSGRHGLAQVVVAAAMVAVTAGGAHAQWTQWGGPGQNFTADSSGLAQSWPADGPRKLWSRDLGDGYSAVLVDGGNLYTMYRAGDKETVICMNAQTGATVWEHAYDSEPAAGHVADFGKGPRATPLIAGDLLYTAGVASKLHCLEKRTGKVLWSHDLWQEFGGNKLQHGYASSPIAYKDKVIALVGGSDASIVAFNGKDGAVVWKKHSFKNSYSTPEIYSIDGQDQLITFMAAEVIGLDPNTGNLLWRLEHGNEFGQNICMPVLHDGVLFISSPQVGSRGVKLSRQGEAWTAEEVWSNKKIQFYHVTTVRSGDWVFGSTGMRQPCFLAGINLKNGEIAWRERGFAKANCLGADGRLIILDEDGNLLLASANPEALTVHSKYKLFDDVSWTVPTVVGKTLYARNKKVLVALDLG